MNRIYLFTKLQQGLLLMLQLILYSESHQERFAKK